jgi:hypothetical protein
MRSAKPSLVGSIPTRASSLQDNRVATHRFRLRTLIWEQNPLEILIRLPMRVLHRVRVRIESRAHARVPKLLLSNLGRTTQVVRERGMKVPELMLSHPSNPCLFPAPPNDLTVSLRLGRGVDER